MNTQDIFGDGLIGSVQVQRFHDLSVIRVHVMASNIYGGELLNEDGVALTGTTCTVREGGLEQGIALAVLRVRQMAHIAKTGRRNDFGLFFYDALPPELQGKLDMGDEVWQSALNSVPRPRTET